MDKAIPQRDNDFEEKIDAAWPYEKWQDLCVMAAVSGGPDSVAMLIALCALRESQTQCTTQANIEVAHFNHGWRAESSDQDEAFVVELCDKLELNCHVGRSNRAERTEEVARTERYEFLQSIAEQRGTRYLATAHTADDQAETILHRIIRGTSLRGLRGIQKARKLSEAVTVVRPILDATRADVVNYLSNQDQTYRLDESNQDQRFTRNRLRHELLPHLAQHYNPSIVGSLLRLGSLADEASAVIQDHQVDPEFESCVTVNDDKTVELDRARLGSLPAFVQRELLARIWREQGWPQQSMGFEQWNRLVDSIQTGTTICLPGGVQVRNDRNVVRLARSES